MISSLLSAAASLLLTLNPGDVAPDFAAPNQDGKTVHLSDYKGKAVLVFFYPKDETPGCTQEACSLRDDYRRFQQKGAVVLGVSRQDSASHVQFRAKNKLPFDLLTDKDGSVAKAFNVGTMPVIGLHKRQSILIAPDGKVARVYSDVDPAKHSAEVLQAMDELKLATPPSK